MNIESEVMSNRMQHGGGVMSNTITHESHDFGFVAELNAYQIQHLVQFAARHLGEDHIRLIVQVVDGEISLDFGGDLRKALVTPVDLSEVTAHDNEVAS